ncbi:GPI transamidase-like protein component PIG-U [Aureobasidium pullulans]|uniref:GPI transamidase-like protein component PIG-U n=1 Tax=Aureobasidium pullulans TaxID=5580 RepID=A0A4S9FFV3_AURPU|nr:GPI transamidase-like protein component PIG-U [Aureobasidium pullulans]THW96716.1 GPI transamidase-like protein component PIG-U [Aureobasidium pullulans]THX26366.1 GPI transamidase-like protein component PIG-U [Aureobasidium pullulans]THX45194.1 GPI transamidase-like protein component PIG-U [Aureobasidium pullulans]
MSTSTYDHVLFASAASVRLSLAWAFPGLPDLLSGRVELSTPVTGFKRLQEGLFLYNHGLSPYDGGVFHQAPLLLPLFSLLPDPARYPLVTVLLYTLVDLASAYALMQIFASGQSYASRFFTSSRESKRWSSSAVAAAHLFNPFVVLTCLARSTNVFGNLFILVSVLKACRGAPFGSAFALALASYMSLHPLLLLPPLAVLCYDSSIMRNKNASKDGRSSALVPFAAKYTAVFAVAIAILFALSYALTGNWSFISSVYASRLLLPDLTPNVGLWWYFFIEIFDSFRNFFLGVFWLHMVSYSPALTIRLRDQPLAAVVLMCGIFAIFQPYANVGDAGFWLSLLSMYGHVHELSRYAFPAISALIYTTLLGPAFYYLWVYAGSGNANFFYAITLVWSLALSVILADMLYAIIRDEWEKERPEMKGKEARQI